MLLEVSAATLPALFENVAAPLLAHLLDPAEIGETLQEKVVIDAEDLSSLLEAWLNALLALVRDQQILPKRIAVQKIDTSPGKPYSVRSEIIGELRDPHRHTFRAPPQTLQIEETLLQSDGNGWSAQISLRTA